MGRRCSGKFVAPENYSHTQQYGLELRLGLGLRLGFGLALVILWQNGGGKNFPGATNFPRHRLVAHRVIIISFSSDPHHAVAIYCMDGVRVSHLSHLTFCLKRSCGEREWRPISNDIMTPHCSSRQISPRSLLVQQTVTQADQCAFLFCFIIKSFQLLCHTIYWQLDAASWSTK